MALGSDQFLRQFANGAGLGVGICQHPEEERPDEVPMGRVVDHASKSSAKRVRVGRSAWGPPAMFRSTTPSIFR